MYNKSIIEEKSKRFAIRIIKAIPHKPLKIRKKNGII